MLHTPCHRRRPSSSPRELLSVHSAKMLLAAHPPLVLKRSRRTTAGGLRPGLVCRADAKSIAVQYYEQVWSKGDESLGKQLLAENHIQVGCHQRVWAAMRFPG